MQEDWLRQAAETTLAYEGVDYPAELSLFVTDDKTVQELNRTYRGIDRRTDVLAFAFREDTGDALFPAPPGETTHLGEVIISYHQAARQAEEQKHLLKQELMILTIHGVLHLLGYDHDHSKKEQKMRAREAEILARLD